MTKPVKRNISINNNGQNNYSKENLIYVNFTKL